MKIILQQIVFLTVITMCITEPIDFDQLEIPGIPIPINKTRSLRSLTCTNADIGPKCADCTTLLACAGAGTPLYYANCANEEPNKPYCVDNVCTSKPGKGCEINFRCTSEGTFPDPSDCTIYHYCNNIGSSPKSFQCPSNYIFSTKTKLCSKYIPCQIVNCLNNKNRWIPFVGNDGYYAFCGIQQTVMFKCTDEDNFVFNPKINKCEFMCRAAINYPDRTNCNGYINCQMINQKLVATFMDCPPNYHYDEVQQKCIRGGACESQVTTPKPPADETMDSNSTTKSYYV